MKGREGKGPPSTDLLVCFPSRAHLTLMPKPICSPARTSSDSSVRRHYIKKSSIRSNSNRVVGQASPLSWSNKTKPISSKDVMNSEPTSPKVTCAGQIKVRSSKPPAAAGSCKNWQSVMEEIERLHNNRKKSKKKKSAAWVESLGFKKDVMQFLTCLRNIRFDFRCFGSFPTSGITSDDDDDDDEDDDEEEELDYQEPRISRGAASDDGETSRTVFSKWFMVLQENNNNNNNTNKDLIVKKEKSDGADAESNTEEAEECAVVVPPPNALLLMRCRSAPAKSWLKDRQESLVEEESNDDDDEEEAEKEKQKEKEKAEMEEEEEEKRKKEEKLIVMRYGADFYKISTDIAKETWVVGGINNRDPLARSRSWKR